jgi:hypothetical protein
MLRWLALVIAMVGLPACWPGHCSGAIRGVNPETEDTFPPDSFWFITVDTGEKDPAVLLAKSGMTSSTVVLEGPQGPVPIDLTPQIASAAHSCAGAGSIHVQPRAPLPPGDYSLVIVLDQIPFPALSNDDVHTWHGHRAIVRTYHVR